MFQHPYVRLNENVGHMVSSDENVPVELGADPSRSLRVLGHHVQGTNALTIQAEVLRVRLSNHELHAQLVSKVAHRPGIFVQIAGRIALHKIAVQSLRGK